MRVFELPEAERVVVGAVGPPGQRVFYIQARQGRRLVTMKVEKAHVAELSARLALLLADVPGVDPSPAGDESLETPVEADFVVGTLSISFDEVSRRVLLVAEELTGEGEAGVVARIGATFDQIAALARRGAELVAAGRPLCRICGMPIDPEGHVCPRTNGQRAPRP